MKKRVLLLIIAGVFVIFPLWNVFLTVTHLHLPSGDVKEGIAALESFNNVDESSVIQKLADMEESRLEEQRALQEKARQEAARESAEACLKAIERGDTTYRKVFDRVYFDGDSLMNGLEAYNILNSNRLISAVSANFGHLEENVPKLIKLRPQVLILHYGINMIGTEDYHLSSFISTYTSLINKIKDGTPSTRIIISCLFPVQTNKATAARFKNVGKYNSAIKEMCKKLNVEYLDSSPVLNAHPECYASDGIHQDSQFYYYWLQFIITEKGIY